jgi:hypothetical protein
MVARPRANAIKDMHMFRSILTTTIDVMDGAAPGIGVLWSGSAHGENRNTLAAVHGSLDGPPANFLPNIIGSGDWAIPD